MSGTWTGSLLCNEIGTAVCEASTETFTITQAGNTITIVRTAGKYIPSGSQYTATGTLCGAYLTFTGSVPGQFTDCGVTQFLDADRLLQNHCYAHPNGIACSPNMASACVGQWGACNVSGTRTPGTPAAIPNPVCR